MPRYVPLLNVVIPSCPVMGFVPSYFVIVVHDTSVKSGCVLGVDGGKTCRRQGYLLGRFSQKRNVLSNHKMCGCIQDDGCFRSEQNALRFDSLGRLVAVVSPCELYVSGFCVDELEENIPHSQSFALCFFSTASSTLGLRFQVSQASSSVLQRQM